MNAKCRLLTLGSFLAIAAIGCDDDGDEMKVRGYRIDGPLTEFLVESGQQERAVSVLELADTQVVEVRDRTGTLGTVVEAGDVVSYQSPDSDDWTSEPEVDAWTSDLLDAGLTGGLIVDGTPLPAFRMMNGGGWGRLCGSAFSACRASSNDWVGCQLEYNDCMDGRL